MKKINFKFLPKELKLFQVLIFCAVLIIIFVVRGLIFADDAPAVPTILSGTAMTSPVSIQLLWNENSTASGITFNVEKKLSTDSSYAPISAQQPNMSFNDTAVTAGSSYDYRVQACLTSALCSDYGFFPTILVPQSGAIPPSPTTFVAGTTLPPVTLTWTTSTTAVSHFNIQKKLSTGSTYTFLTTMNYPTMTYSDTAVVAGASYDYQIQACLTGYGCSSYTTLSGILIPVIIPPPPATLTNSTTMPPVTLSWTMPSGSNNVYQFNLQKRISGTSNNFSPIGTYGYSVTTMTDTSVVAGTSYDYQIQACASPNNSSNCSPFTQLLGVLIPGGTTVPNAPTNLTAVVNGNNVTLHWTDNSSDEAGFKIYRGPTWTDIGNVGPNITTFVDSNRPSGIYTYHLNAFNSNNNYSPISNDVSVTVTSGGGGGGGGTPNSPTGLMINGTVTSTSVPLKWTDNSSNEDSFKIYRRAATTGTYTSIGQIGTSITNYIDSTVSPGFYYDYQVQACLGTSCSSYATLSGVSVPTSGNGQNIPNPPTNLAINGTVTYSSVPLTWVDNSSNEDSFKIEKKITGSTASFSYIGQVGTSIANYTDTSGLIPGVSYDYRVQACLLNIGCSTYATLPSVLIPSTTGGNGGNNNYIPSAPTNLTVVASSSMPPIQLHWIDNAINEDKFNIDRKLSTSTVWTSLTQIQQSNVTSYIDNSTILVPGVSYDYRVQACLSGTGCSAYATLTGFVIPTSNNTAPISPTNFIINGNPTYSSIPLKWTDNSNNEDGFRIEKKLSSAVSYNFVIQTVPNVTTFTDVNSGTNLYYDYRIQACKGALCSPFIYLYGVTTQGTTVLPPPLNTTTIVPLTTSTPSSLTTTSGTQITPNTPTAAQSAISSTTNPTIPNTPSTTQPTTSKDTTSPTSGTVAAVPEPIGETNVVVAPTAGVPLQIQNIGLAVEQIQNAVDDTKGQLVKLINDSVNDIIDKASIGGQEIDKTKIFSLRDELLQKVNDSFSAVAAISPSDIDNLQNQINQGIESIKSTATKNTNISKIESTPILNSGMSIAFDNLSQTVTNQSAALTQQGGDLLYKDSNKDGISDYNSVYVYNMDPIKPSPVSSYEGKSVNAGDKILLGFDPTKKDLVKVTPEQPAESIAPTVPVYKVDQVALAENKQIEIKGKALPNSFVTIYIYSTPIMVTVKTDSRGDWQYTLNKELENGDHTIYTATVNNSGNIIAKSPGYLFTKTAEAVTLKNIPTTQASADTNKPGLLEGNSLIAVIMFILGVAVTALILIGVVNKKNKEGVVEKSNTTQ